MRFKGNMTLYVKKIVHASFFFTPHDVFEKTGFLSLLRSFLLLKPLFLHALVPFVDHVTHVTS